MEIANNGQQDGKCRLTGVMGNIFNIAMEKLNDQGIKLVMNIYQYKNVEIQ